jgi:hypothetical protein
VDRRQFLIRSGAVIGALITPSFVAQVAAKVLDSNAPLLIQPVKVQKTLYAFALPQGGFSLHLGDPDNPESVDTPKTFHELLVRQKFGKGNALVDFVMDGWSLDFMDALRKLQAPPPPDWLDAYLENEEGTQAKAYRYLKRLELGEKFGTLENHVGEIYFVNRFNPYSNGLGVEVPDLISLSLLQARLVELGKKVDIKFSTCYEGEFLWN